MTLNPRARVLLIATAILLALVALVWALSTRRGTTPVTPIDAPPPVETVATPNATPVAATPTPLAFPSVAPSTSASPGASVPPSVETTPAPAGQSPSSGASNSTGLLIPVAGVKPSDLHDTYNDARSEGRTHNAIDIIAARGTPVVAVADGRIVKLFNSEKGGITLYQLSADERTIYYYAHLDRYADGLQEQRYARRGDLLGYVGDTGNATPGNYHLHFEVSLVSDPKRYWESTPLNPYPLLAGGR